MANGEISRKSVLFSSVIPAKKIMNQNDLKRMAAEAAIAYVAPDSVVGVGTGSTVNHFIAALAKIKVRLKGAVSSRTRRAQ